MTKTFPDRPRLTKARRVRIVQLMESVPCIVLGTVLAIAGVGLEDHPTYGTPAVMANLDAAQVEQPVTAVLLNFRGFDTWLEVGVLAVAVMSVLALHRRPGLDVPVGTSSDPVLSLVSRILFPFMVLVSGYLLWAGTHSPGGAFQAGAVLGGAGVLLQLAAGTAPWLERLMRGGALRVLALTGFLFFLVFGITTLVAGRQFLEYPPDLAGALILVIEAAVTVSIGWTLTFLYMGATPSDQDDGPIPRDGGAR